jgi:hypothetical protein
MKTMTALGAALLAAGLTACAVQTPTVSTRPAAGSTPAAAAHHGGLARIGSTMDLAGFSASEKMAVTVVRVITRAHGSGFSDLSHGNRFYAVQFRLRDIGSAAYSDSPSNGAAVVDSKGQSYQSDFSAVSGCQSFPASENIAVGSSGLGCVVFQVPEQAKITEIQFTLDSGMASQTGQWKA